MLNKGFGKLPPVGGPFACPGCLTAVPGFNPAVGIPGPILPFGPVPPFNKGVGTFGPIPPYNKNIGTWGPIGPMGTYPGICTGCV
ncbi:MAG TPA: hypothetical protein VD902_06120 [Symbiobacteriaceae bacterium]|nr:hypothetical protein [Symbiobacteriaceae bacterium]